MPCACGKNKKSFEVVSKDGKVLFTNTSEATVRSVSKRYEGSTVREKPKEAAAGAAKSVTKA